MNFIEFLKEHYDVNPNLPDRYGDWLGYEIDLANKDSHQIETSLMIRDDHLSPSGAVHGGVISGFLDFSCGCSVISSLNKGEACSTVELNVKYFKPIRSGEKIIAKSKLIHRGRTLCSVIAEVFNTKDLSQTIALATGTFNIYRVKSKT